MKKWQFTIIEKSTFFVELDEENRDAAYEKIRDMFCELQLDSTDPDYYESEDTIEEVKETE